MYYVNSIRCCKLGGRESLNRENLLADSSLFCFLNLLYHLFGFEFASLWLASMLAIKKLRRSFARWRSGSIPLYWCRPRPRVGLKVR